MPTTTEVSPAPAGRSIDQFVREAGICRASYYNLPTDCQPRSVKIGKRRIVIESPTGWLERMAERGGVACTKAAA